MRRAGPDFCWLGLAVLVVLLALAVSGPVMRESDQAALLEGAVDLARSGDGVDRRWYNYDKQFLSYWTLAGVLDFAGLDAPGSNPAEVVKMGNRAAAIFFSVALLIAIAASPRRSMSTFPILLLVFLTPALMFSIPLLSSNVFSASCLLLLAAALRKRNAGWLNALLCAGLTAAAVGFRRDAGLVLPMLCLLSTTRFSIAGIFRERRHWLMLAAALGMVGLGLMIVREADPPPKMFLHARLFGAYLFFGLTGAAVVVFWLPLRLLISRRRWFLRAATGIAMLLPFAFYAAYLYTPRHFFLSTVLLLLVLILPRGELWWQAVLRRPFDRFLVWSAVVATTVLWLVGVHLPDQRSPKLVFESPTLYPTADGFWPMGCYRNFLITLSHAGQMPIDHNQEMWDAWTQVQEDRLPMGDARVHSAGLRAYGYLALRLKGRGVVTGDRPGDFDLVPDRSLDRALPGFSSYGHERDEISWDSCWLESVGGTGRRQVYLATKAADEKRSLALRWVAQLVIVSALGPDDFHLREAGLTGNWFREASRGFRFAAIFADQAEAARFEAALTGTAGHLELKPVSARGVEAFVVTWVYEGAVSSAARSILEEHGSWITRSLLPAFMSRSNY